MFTSFMKYARLQNTPVKMPGKQGLKRLACMGSFRKAFRVKGTHF